MLCKDFKEKPGLPFEHYEKYFMHEMCDMDYFYNVVSLCMKSFKDYFGILKCDGYAVLHMMLFMMK
jgi:hypothetical protein